MENTILEIRNVTKKFPGIIALKNVTMDIRSNEIHGICGENGAGKSTLIKILSGVYPYHSYEGSFFIGNEECRFSSIKDAEDKGIAAIYQELALFQKLSIAENIFINEQPTKYGFIEWYKILSDTTELLDRVGLKLNPEEILEDIGVGQQQLVEIAKALSKDAKILILDEPTSALTETEVDVLMSILKKLKQSEVTCIFISHKLDEILYIADRISVLRDGELIDTDETAHLNKNSLIQMMVGRKLSNIFPKEEFERKDIVLEVKNLNLYDPEKPQVKILDNIRFSAYRGEILGFAGLMGSGRTELASSIFGINAKHREGEIFINGNKLDIRSPLEAIRKGLIYLSEDRKRFGLVLNMEVKENATLAELNRLNKLFIDSHKEISDTREYVRYLNIKTASVETVVNNLSGGNQQKVVLSKWLMTKPRILFLDEVTRGIDVGAKYEIYKIMNTLVKEGVVIILISSELPEILGMCDRILVMHEGKITGEVIREEATQEKIMHYATQ